MTISSPHPNHEVGRLKPERERGTTPDTFFLISQAVRERQETVLNFIELESGTVKCVWLSLDLHRNSLNQSAKSVAFIRETWL